MSRGQALSIDLGISIMLFTIAVMVTYGLLENTLAETSYEDVRRQAIDVSDVLISKGYPAGWANTEVLRAGIVSQEAISMRKARELPDVDSDTLRQSVRATDSFLITARNETGIEAIFGTCGVGDLTIPETPANRTLPAIAMVRDPHPVADATNATQYETDAAYAILDRHDVLLIEGNLSQGSAFTRTQIARELAALATHGITAIIIGDPGVPTLGVVVNRTNATQVTISSVRAADIGLPLGQIDLPVETEIPTITESPASEIADWTVLGTTEDGAVAAATWVYDDARIWYVATSDGTLANGSALIDALGPGTESRITVPWPSCGPVTIPSDATAIARYDRAVAYHDQVLTLRVIVWRDY